MRRPRPHLLSHATLVILSVTVIGTPTPDTRPDPKYWSSWPVIPTLSAAARQIYEHGIALGNNPHVFSSIGDCQSAPNVFMGSFETSQSVLGPQDVNLKQTVLYFAGSFSRQSLAVHDGLSPASALSPLWADRTVCGSDESPVACELRIRKPSIMFVNLGTNWKAGASAAPYEAYLRQIIDLLIAHGTLPILSTKADNVEGDHSLDLATAKVAHDYDIPLWNFWLASDTLPNHGLDASRANVYLAPLAWGPRNYSALQVLDSIWRALDPSAAAEGAALSATATAAGAAPTLEGPAPTTAAATPAATPAAAGYLLLHRRFTCPIGASCAMFCSRPCCYSWSSTWSLPLSLDRVTSALGRISAYNLLFPGRPRFPFGEDPSVSYNLSLYNLDAMFASHLLAAGGPKPSNQYRVLLLGDLSVWGTLLRPQDTLAGQLNAAIYLYL